MIKKVIISAFIITLVSCTGRSSKEYANVDELLQDAKTKVEYVSVDALKEVLDTHEPVYLIDCREPEEFNIACIKTAMNIPRGVLEGNISEKAPKHRNAVYLYCDNGDRSTLAALVLPQLKYADVKVLEGGFEALQAKYPDLVEHSPVRGGTDTKVVAKPSGGCGG